MKHKFFTKTTRLLALILALSLVVGLTGCFQKDDPQPTDEPTSAPTENTPTQEPPTEEPTEEPTEVIIIEPGVESVMGTVSANNLNVRSNPSTDSTVLSQLPVDLRIEILEQKTVGETNWGRIGEMTLPNGTKIGGGWINLAYVQIDGEEPAPTEPPVETEDLPGEGKTGTITASELNIRKGAGTNYESVGKYIKGDKVEILEQKTVDGTAWGRTNKGWISMKYVKLDSASETPTEDDKKDETPSDVEIVSDGKTKTLGYGIVNSGALNVRSGPGTKYDAITTARGYTRHAYYQKSGNWVRIKDGWVSTAYFYVEGTTGEGAGTGKVNVDLRIRTGPSTAFNNVGSYNKGDSVKILAQINGWGYTGKGWISMKYVDMDETETTYKTGKGTVTADTLNIRKEASSDSKSLGKYKKGDKVEILEVKGAWGRTDKGWISLKYVKMDAAKDDKDDDKKYDDDEIGKNTKFKKGTATVKVNSTLTIRKSASQTAEKVGAYEDGAKVKILEVKGEWGRTDKGWINLRYVVYS